MSWKPRRPYRAALVVVPLLVGLVGAAAIYGCIVGVRTPPADLDAALSGDARVTDRTAALEREWIRESISERYLAAPPGPAPCVWGLETVSPEIQNEVASALEREDVRVLAKLHDKNSDQWLPGLVLAHLLVRQGDLGQAGQILREVAARRVLPSKKGEAEARPSELILAGVDQLQLQGYIWIERRHTSNELWPALKNPIGLSTPIASSREEYATEVPNWRKVTLPAPGCPPSEDSLTTHDLYNNLIVGYLPPRSLPTAITKDRDKEFYRDYSNSPENPLLATLSLTKQNSRPDRESWLWAISNAERVLHERLEGGEGYPQDARLALNLAQLMESAWDSAPANARGTLREQIDSLVEVAQKTRNDIAEKQIAAFDQGLARLVLLRAARDGKAPELLEGVRNNLGSKNQSLIDGLTKALKYRQEPSAWAAVATGTDDPELSKALGTRLGPWLAASRQDLAASLARVGLSSGDEKVHNDWARKAESMLGLEDIRPPELDQLEKNLPWWWRYEPRQWLTSAWGALVAGVLAGAVLALLAYWFCLQLRLRKELFTSFYRTEVEQRLRS